jgi:CBS domain containing-hemolysin-like protein
VIPLGLALLFSVLLVLANAFFVASEFALVKIRPTQLETLLRQGSRRAAVALDVCRKLDAYLSANQLGITLASLALGWLGEPAFARLVEPLFSFAGRFSRTAAHTAAVVIGFSLITFLHVVMGELAPKSLAIQRTEPVALWTAGPLRIFYKVAYPLIWLLNRSSSLVLRLFGLQPASEAEAVHTPEEMRLVLQHVRLGGGARGLIDRVFDYSHRLARQVMTFRSDVVTLDVNRSFRENLDTMLQNQYTRYPLLDGDQVLGYIHIKDVMAALASGTVPERLRLLRQPLFVKDDQPIEELRREFQRRRVHLGIVMDHEKGEFIGIVTLEDLLEEVVGEILDEQDVGEVPPIVRTLDGGFEVEGRLTLDVAHRELGLTLPDAPKDVETLGGYVMTRMGVLPRPGESLEVPGYRLVVVEVRDRRVRRLRGEPLPAQVEEVEKGPDGGA